MNVNHMKDNKKIQASTIVVLSIVITGFTASIAQGSSYFLGIGNDGYFSDVEGLWNNLSSQRGWENATNNLLENRTGTQIESDISWLQQAGPGDVVLFFYSGHGRADNENDGDESNGWAIDSYDETIGCANNYSTDDSITDAISLIDSAAHIITVFDTCYAGGFVGGANDLSRLDNVTALLSSREDQYSYGGYPYSLFTTGLVEGISSALPADLNGDGILYTDEWFNYAASQMPSGYNQDPVYWVSGSENAAIVTPEPTTMGLLTLGSLSLLRKRRV